VLELTTQLAQHHQLVLLARLVAIAIKLSKLHANQAFIVILQLMQLSTNSARLEHIQLLVQVQLHVLSVMVARLAHKLV